MRRPIFAALVFALAAATATAAGAASQLIYRVDSVTAKTLNGHLVVTASGADPAMLAEVIRRLDDDGIEATEVGLRLPSLDEVFLTLTGHAADSETGKEQAA